MAIIDGNGFSEPIDYQILSKMIKATKNEKYKLLWNLLYYTGSRISAALALRRIDCFYLDGKLRSKILFRSENLKKSGGHRQPPLEIPIALPLKYQLKSYQFKWQDCPWLFEGKLPDRHLSRKTADDTFRATLRKIGLEKAGFSLHGFRHNFFLLLHKKNASKSDFTRLTGNKHYSSIQRYLELSSDRSVELIDSMF